MASTGQTVPTQQTLFQSGAVAICHAVQENCMSSGDLAELLQERPEAGGLGELITEAVLNSLGIPLDGIVALKSGKSRLVMIGANEPSAPCSRVVMSQGEIAASLYAAAHNYVVAVPFSKLPERLREPWQRAAEAACTYISADMPPALAI